VEKVNILIAGGAGYVGTLLANTLVKDDHQVDVVDYFWFGDYLDPEITRHVGNIFDLTIDSLKNNKYDVVVFLAGLSNDPMANYDPAGNFIENSAAPSYLAYIAKESGVSRFVYASSCSVYGFTDGEALDEDCNPKPHYPYGIAKLQAESAIMLLEDENFKPISLRKGTIGGWSPRMRFDLVVNAMTKSAITSGKIVVNNPNLWRPLIDIRDVVQSYVKSIETNVTGIFNICAQNYTIGDLAAEIRYELIKHGHNIEIETMHKEDIRNYKASNKKAKELLGFEPIYSPSDSVREILENIDLNNINFGDERYYNIQTFKKVKNEFK